MADQLDEITNARRLRVNKIRKKRFLIFFLICFALIVFYMLVTSYSEIASKDFKDLFHTVFASGSYPIEMSETVTMVEKNDQSVVLLSPTSIKTVKGSGALIFEAAHGLTSAEMASRSGRIVVYSQSGKSYKVYNRSSMLTTGNTSFEIAGAAVLSSGRYCLLTRGDEYTCELHVFNKDTSKRFTWYGTDGFPLDVIASESGDTVLVISVKSTEGRLFTVLTIINTASQKEEYSFSHEGLYVDAMLNGDDLVVVFDSEAVYFRKDGQIQSSFSFEGKQLLKIAHQEGDNIALCFGDNSRSEINTIVVLSKKLSQVMFEPFKREIHSIWLDSDDLYVLSRGRVFVYSTNGVLKKSYACSTSSYGIYEWGGPVVLESQFASKLTETTQTEENNES